MMRLTSNLDRTVGFGLSIETIIFWKWHFGERMGCYNAGWKEKKIRRGFKHFIEGPWRYRDGAVEQHFRQLLNGKAGYRNQ